VLARRRYMQQKILKLADQFRAGAVEEGLQSRLFEKVVIYVNGNTSPSKDVRTSCVCVSEQNKGLRGCTSE
jgi:hypothetical protein